MNLSNRTNDIRKVFIKQAIKMSFTFFSLVKHQKIYIRQSLAESRKICKTWSIIEIRVLLTTTRSYTTEPHANATR